MLAHSVKNGAKTCIMCRESLPVEQYYVWKYTTNQGRESSRYESRCKACSRQRRKDYTAEKRVACNEKQRIRRANNPERTREQAKRNKDNDRARAQRVASEAKRRAKCGRPSKETAALFTRVMDEAAMCGGWMDAYSGRIIHNPTIDHIVPIARGGQNEYENLCVTSRQNNSRKRATPLLLWLMKDYHV